MLVEPELEPEPEPEPLVPELLDVPEGEELDALPDEPPLFEGEAVLFAVPGALAPVELGPVCVGESVAVTLPEDSVKPAFCCVSVFAVVSVGTL